MTDEELRGLFEAMRQDIGAVRADTVALREDNATIHANVGAIRADTEALRADNVTIHADIGAIRADTEALRADNVTIHADVGAIRADTEALRADNVTIHSDIASIRQEGVERRRHFDIVAETMRKEIRIVAEGVLSIDEKLDRTAAELRGKIEETKTMIEFSTEQLRRRVSALEKK